VSSLGGRRATAAVAVAVLLLVAEAPRAVHAGCNVIPPAVTTFRATLGQTDKPFAKPGDWVTISLDPTCHGAPPFTEAATEYVVSVVFTPPLGGQRNLVAVAADCGPFMGATCPSAEVSCVEVNAGALVELETLAGGAALRFRFPDTDAFFAGPADDLTFTGPATLAARPTGQPLPCELATDACADVPNLLACVDALFADNSTCDSTRDKIFGHFTALPPPNTYADLCTDPSPDPCTGLADEARFTIDATGNILLPMDWRDVRVDRDAVPVARLLRSATTVEAFPGRGVPIRIPDLSSLGSYSPEGIKLPPLFDPQQDPTVASSATFFGSTDAEETVLRVARHAGVSDQCAGGPNLGLPCTEDAQCAPGTCGAPTCAGGSNAGAPCTSDSDCLGGECGPGLFDFSTRLLSDMGPVVVQRGACVGGSNPGAPCIDDSVCLDGGRCESFTAAALDPVPLEGLNQSEDVNAFIMEEAIPNPPVDLNGDGDEVDHVIKLFSRASGLNDAIGSGGSEGRAITRILQAPFSFPAMALGSGGLVAYLEPEANQADTDQNLDGERFDTILKVFRLGAGELTDPLAPLPVDAAPLVNGRSLAISDQRVFYRRPEAAAARWATVAASVAYDGSLVDFDFVSAAAISGDGRYVAFTSSFRPFIVPEDDSGIGDVFVRDLTAATVERVSVDSDGVAGNDFSGGFVTLSHDGRFVAFASVADNLVTGDGNGARDVFVHDRDTGTTERVSVSSAQDEGNGGSNLLSLSDDGRFVSFTSDATNLVNGDMNSLRDVFLRDRETGTTERVSISSAGVQGDAPSGATDLFGGTARGNTAGGVSADGRFVVFISDATTLVAGDTNGASDVFLRDRATQTTEVVSVSSAGTLGNAGSFDPAMSADGRIVVFASGASNLVPGDTNSITDVFARDRSTGATTRVSVFPDGSQIPNDLRGASGAGVSADGRFVSFASDRNLVPPEANIDFDVYVQDRLTNLLRVVPSSGIARLFGGVSRDGQHAFTIDDPPGGGAGPVYASGPIADALCGNSMMDPGEDCDPPGSATCAGGQKCAPNCECVDLTQDGEIDDTVLEVLDASGMSTVVSTLCAAADVAVADGNAAFLRPEASSGPAGSCPPGPLNGDADTDDLVVHCWDGSGAAQNLARGATAVAAAGGWVAALVSEAADDEKYNGDNDKTDTVAQVHPICDGDWVSTGQAADAIAAAGSTVAFTTPEEAQGKNLNGDADTDDRVLQVFDTQIGKLTNVGKAAEDFVVGAQRLVAFRTREASQGQGSLNLDGANNDNDTLDDVLQVYDAASGAVLNSRQAVTPCKLEACDPHVPYRVLNDTVRFLTLEADQNDDLNGDGDQGDLVVQVLNVRQACNNGSPAGACHTLAAISAGVCTTTAEACASDDACGVGGTCFTPPFGCVGAAGACCDTDPEDGMNPCGMGGSCGGGEFCQPVLGMPGEGTCRALQGPCLSDADCSGGATCNTSDQNFQRLLAPVNALRGSDVFTASGRCIEEYPSAVCSTNADCDTGQFCRNGTCHRAHGVCTDDAGCPTGSTCSKELTRAAVDDGDLDELPDLFDNCPLVANIMQEDSDGDGVGDACEQQLTAGGKLMLKDRDGDASKRKLAVLSKDPALVAPPPASGADPTQTGAELRLFNPGTQEQAAFALPSAGWKGLGTPPGAKGYKYIDKDLVNGPCKKVLIRPGKLLKAVCRGSQIAFTLDEPTQGLVAVRFSTGSGSAATSSCLRFGGTVVHDTQATAGKSGQFKAVDAPPPPACPVP
jgi:Tol biopolymer transport system component